MAIHPSRSSRRDLLRGGAAVGAATLLGGGGLGRRAAAADTSAWQEYLDQSFSLRDLAEKKGKIIAYGVGGSSLHLYQILRQSVYEQGNGVECDQLCWYLEGNPGASPLPTADLQDINWSELDKVIDFVESSRQTAGNEHLAVQSLIFGDTGSGESTTGDQRVPDWLINGGYTYSQSIQMANQYIKSVMLHLQQKQMLDPRALGTRKTLRVGVLNELLNNSLGPGGILIDVNEPTTWFKKANYWTNQAFAAGDPFTNGYPEYVKQALLIARKYGGDALIGVSDWNIETWHDYRFGGPNQKAQAMYNLIKLLKADPDLKEVFDKGFYLGMQGHFDFNLATQTTLGAQALLQLGLDDYAKDFGETVRRFKDDFAIEVVLTETTIATKLGETSINDNDQANIENALALAAFQNGVDEWVVFYPSDVYPDAFYGSIFDSAYRPKLSYAGLAAALDGKRITF